MASTITAVVIGTSWCSRRRHKESDCNPSNSQCVGGIRNVEMPDSCDGNTTNDHRRDARRRKRHHRPPKVLEHAANRADKVLFRSMTSAPGSGDTTWQNYTYADVRSLTARTAAGLQALDVEPGERVMLMMRNRPDFHWLDLGAQFVRATPVSIYNSSSPEELQYLAEHAEARVIIVEDSSFLDRVLEVRDQLPLLEHIFVIEEPVGGLPEGVRLVDDLLANGEADLDTLAAVTSPDDLATLIYTSGTTGPPKGVMITQYNIMYAVAVVVEALEEDDIENWRVISYLPMAHIAERVTGHYQALVTGGEVSTCPDPSLLPAYLGEVHPSLLFGVPRVFEKVYAGVNAALAADPERQKAFNDGVAAALEIKEAERAGTITQEQRDTWEFLDAVAFSQVRALVGMDELKIAITGAAPFPQRSSSGLTPSASTSPRSTAYQRQPVLSPSARKQISPASSDRSALAWKSNSVTKAKC